MFLRYFINMNWIKKRKILIRGFFFDSLILILIFYFSKETFNLKPQLNTLMALVIGLILFGLGEALLVSSQIGVSPWTALGQGLANVSELSLGLTTFLISVFVLFLWSMLTISL